MEAACTRFMQNFTFMLSRAPFVMESFAKEQDGGDNSINIKVRFSSEQPQQRGGRQARKRRSKRRELERTEREASSPQTTVENVHSNAQNAGIRENVLGYGRDDGFFSDISPNDGFITDIQQDIPRQIHRPGIPQLAAYQAAYTGLQLAPGKHQRSVTIRPDTTENYGHLYSLLKSRLFKLEEKVSRMETDKHTALETISKLQQLVKINSRPKTSPFKRSFCRYCSQFETATHYCKTKRMFRHEDYFLLWVLEGSTEENLQVIAIYPTKLQMRDAEGEIAAKWIRSNDEKILLDNEKQHLLAKTQPSPLASPPNSYLIEIASYPGENWETLGGKMT